MQLLRLRLGALGPFPGEHDVDLAELGASGLFLLEGPTGAGKSTLIDAIVFALYGKVASPGASEDRLRSNHAAADAETYVELEFATGAGTYRVRRTPAYQRAKQRGTGTTTQQATIKLWRLSSPDAPGELLTTRLDEAGLELQQIVGLDRTQFVQTVVLPQGEFAAFLRSDPEHRRGLLQRLFGTEVYERVQQRLERMRAEASRGVAEAEQAAAREVARFLGAAELPEPEQVDARALADLTRRLEADARRASEVALSAAEAAVVARVERDRRAALVVLLERRAALRAESTELDAAADEHASRCRRLAAATAAEQCWPAVEAASLASRARSEAAAALEVARSGASDDLRAVVGAADAEIALKALADEIERTATARGALARALHLEAGLTDRREDLASRREALATARLAVEQGRAALAEVPELRAELTVELGIARSAAGGLPAARVAAREAEAAVAAAHEAAALDVRLADAEVTAREAAGAAHAAAAALAEAHRARIAGIAGELAATLEPGAPCVVCGSLEHPAPAPGAAEPPDIDGLEAARAGAEGALRSAVSEVERLRERRAALGDVTADEDAVGAAQDAVAAAEAAVVREAELASRLAAHERQWEADRAELTAREQVLVVDETRAQAELAALESDEAEVLAAADGAPSVRARDEEHRRRGAQARTWAEALDALVEAETVLAREERERDRVLDAAGLALDEVLRVRLPRAEVAALRSAIEAHTTRVAQVTGALAELPELPDGEVDLAGAEQAAAEADATARTAGGEAAVLERRAQAAARAREGVEAAWHELDAARAAAEPVTRMANVAAASGGEGALTLATYVLGQRFADLVAAANARLGGISDGRYELLRSTEKEAVRTRRIGLALSVLDHRTGVARDPRTLSGGETFYVSLCLALGLADVVTAEAGGIELGTLLIDEGFGSLDAETLDVVLAELGRLREGGRTVGVVSHVETLKQAIAERIEVRRRPDGASTLTVRC
ncbi:SMC family ATPase [Actinotalea sp. M2MS4P-6]|uniref:AAA family ATPase n=1 Tax=Actinotalea sp. M2MS4P-6 TaxID=2983762 RepID=UPI0021E3B809|nr:SMC family ATPase [Actinotalea sp. M2MS4P-6]MCV2392724.1 SMC family ATPase [Actinotalea sp. M2MS4P-6]